MLAGIMKRPHEWNQLLPNFFTLLAGGEESYREKVIRDLIEAAIDRFSINEYTAFVENIAVSLASMPEEVRASILKSNIITPKGLPRNKAEMAREALSEAIRKNIVNSSKNRNKLIRIVFESVLLMDDEDAEEVISGITNSTIKLGALDYVKYTYAWMNVLGSMDRESVKRLLELRADAFKGFDRKKIEERSALSMAAVLLISAAKRKKILDAMKSLE